MTITTVLHSRAAPSLEYLPGILCFVKGCHINMMDLNVKQIAHVNIMSDIFLPITRSIPCKKMNNNERDIRHFFERRKNTKKKKTEKSKSISLVCFCCYDKKSDKKREKKREKKKRNKKSSVYLSLIYSWRIQYIPY